jgi:hypothetical protein
LLSMFFTEDAETAWTYRSPTHKFQIDLPSDEWTEFNRADSAAAFMNQRRRAFFSVKVAKDKSGEGFETKVRWMKDFLVTERDSLREPPQYSEGLTDAGNPFSYYFGISKAEKGDDVVVAQSFVWCKEKAIVVEVLFEGNLMMQSETGKTQERKYYEQTCKSICQSPR